MYMQIYKINEKNRKKTSFLSSSPIQVFQVPVDSYNIWRARWAYTPPQMCSATFWRTPSRNSGPYDQGSLTIGFP